MVHTLDRPDTAASDSEDDSVEAELPTNRLSSTNLREANLSSEAHLDSSVYEVDWVQMLTAINPVTQQLEDGEPDPMPAPSGMGQHVTGPARMVPSRRSFISGGVKRALLAILLVGAVGGGMGVGIYAIVDSGWLATVFPAQVASSAQPPSVSQPGIQATPQTQPTVVQAPTAPPQPVTTGNPADVRDKGIEQYKLGNYDKAIEILEGVVSAGSNDARTYYHLGLAYLAVTGRKHSLDDAELAFRTAASLDPTWAASHNMLAESLVRHGYYAEAIPEALEATRLDPNSGDAWMTLSRAYKGTGQEADATRASAEAARRAPAPPQP